MMILLYPASSIPLPPPVPVLASFIVSSIVVHILYFAVRPLHNITNFHALKYANLAAYANDAVAEVSS